MAYDGTIKFNTAVDTAGFNEGMKSLESSTVDSINTIISVIETVGTVLKGVTAAQGLVKAIASGNVVGIVLSSITLLISAIDLATDASEAYQSETSRLTAMEKEKSAALKEQSKEFEKVKEQANENTAIAEHQAAKTAELAGELLNLCDAGGRVDEENRARASYIITTLNGAFGTEIEMVDGVIQKYDDLSEMLSIVIAKKRAQSIIDANSDAVDQATENYVLTLGKLDEQYKLIQETEKQLAHAREKLGIAQAEQNILDEMSWDWMIDIHLEDLETQTKYYDELMGAMGEYNTVLEASDTLIEAMATGSMVDINNAIYTFASTMEQSGADVENSTTGMNNSVTETLEDLAGTVEFTAQGVQAGFVQASDLTVAKNNFMSGLESFSTAGGDITQKITDGVTKKEYMLADELARMAGISTETLVNAFESGDLSEVGKELGLSFAEGYVESIGSSADTIEGVTSGFTEAAVEGGKKGQRSNSPSKATMEMGDDFVQGFADGIEKNASKAINAAIGMAKAALTAVQNELGIKSPSRVMRDEVGAMIARGMAIGIKENSWEVTKATKQMFDDLKLQLEVGAINEEQYYERLYSYRDAYLESGTKEWWDYTKTIMKYEGQEIEHKKLGALIYMPYLLQMYHETNLRVVNY